jgi:hypothetical protein
MAVFYGVPAGKTFIIAGPADVTVKGGEYPMIVDDVAEYAAAAPTVATLTPSSAEIGAEDFTLVVSGEGFTADSVIVFNIHDEPTTFNADGTLSTGVKPSLWGSPVTVPVSVRNGPAHSQSLDFSFTDPATSAASRKRSK